jgi:AcrR family transcriptional regulator
MSVHYQTPHREMVRARIIRSAQQLFLAKGFTDVSIDDVMAGAGLTRGGFYTYFASKSALYAEAIRSLMQEKFLGGGCDTPPHKKASDIIKQCLSVDRTHGDNESNLLLAHPGDLLLNDATISSTYELVVKTLIGAISAGITGSGDDRHRALAIVAILIGCMTGMRSLRDPVLVEDMCKAAMDAALMLGGWSERDTEDCSEPAQVAYAAS